MSVGKVSGPTQVQPAASPPKRVEAEQAAPVPQEKVSISPDAAKLAAAAAGGDADHDGDSK